jgi:hypothetical protein
MIKSALNVSSSRKTGMITEISAWVRSAHPWHQLTFCSLQDDPAPRSTRTVMWIAILRLNGAHNRIR